jgi:hypothetical protein
MEDNKKQTIIKEALTDYKAIIEAAENNAKKKLADEYPEKFNNLIKEELNDKNKIKKESNKKNDENKESEISDKNESNNENDVMKSQTKETKKKVEETTREGKPFNKKVNEPAKVEEDVKITDTVGNGQPFDEKPKKSEIVEESEKEFMGDVEPNTPNKGNGDKGDIFTDKIKSSQKPISNLNEMSDSMDANDFDITELDEDSISAAIDDMDKNSDDEFMTMDNIDSEISKIDGNETEIDGEETEDSVSELIELRNKLNDIIDNMSTDETPIEDSNSEIEEPIDNVENDTENIDEIDAPITDADIEAVLGSSENDVDEAHGLSYSSRRQMSGRNLPKKEHLSTPELDQAPYLGESKKKINGLIEENKKLTKKLNESKKFKNSVTTLIEGYKTALGKYRDQLRDMAIFNTNLANVNNILVNEELALTHDDKIKIINEFKNIDSISSSKEKYSSILSEMKENKKTISESIEDKITTSIQSSSKQKLDEVIEKTAYADNAHINKMKNIINYVEKRGKK